MKYGIALMLPLKVNGLHEEISILYDPMTMLLSFSLYKFILL
jgi:hypothetical protein